MNIDKNNNRSGTTAAAAASHLHGRITPVKTPRLNYAKHETHDA